MKVGGGECLMWLSRLSLLNQSDEEGEERT